eukprot:5270667-Pyramimonas_sp.AAC.1
MCGLGEGPRNFTKRARGPKPPIVDAQLELDLRGARAMKTSGPWMALALIKAAAREHPAVAPRMAQQGPPTRPPKDKKRG